MIFFPEGGRELPVFFSVPIDSNTMFLDGWIFGTKTVTQGSSKQNQVLIPGGKNQALHLHGLKNVKSAVPK